MILTNDTNELNKCFDKHPFNELNNIDIDFLYSTLKFILPKIKEGCFFDVGCNCGSFIKALSLLEIRSNIHAFEPHPVLFKKVKETYPYACLFEGCLGSTDGDIDIYIPCYSCGISSIINRPVFNTFEHPVVKYNTKITTVDRYCEKNNINYINFIKIDVEGYEFHVLKGAENMLKSKKILCGCYEIGSTLKDAGTSEEEIANYLSNLGYSISSINNENKFFYDANSF